MSNTNRSKEDKIRSLRAKNIRMGKELGILRVVTVLLVLLLIITLIMLAVSRETINKFRHQYPILEENLIVSGTEEGETMPTENGVIEITEPEEEIIDPSEWFVTDTEPTEESNNTIEDIPPVSVCSIEMFDKVPLGDDLIEFIYNSAIENDIPPEIMFALAKVESSYDEHAVSKTNDHGLFQINTCNFKSLAAKLGYTYDELCDKIYDPFVNTKCAIYMLLEFRDKYASDNWHIVLMRYNMGPSGAKKQFDNGVYSTKYTRKIVEYAQSLFGLTDITIG